MPEGECQVLERRRRQEQALNLRPRAELVTHAAELNGLVVVVMMMMIMTERSEQGWLPQLSGIPVQYHQGSLRRVIRSQSVFRAKK